MANRSGCFLANKAKTVSGKTFMSTNTSLSFIEMVKIYQLRWCIESIFSRKASSCLVLVSANQLILMLR
jgi:hypothetical protein